MDFLSTAIISAQNNSVLGALLTHFDPTDYQSRASLKMYTAEELAREQQNMDPRGFKFEPSGTLLSDTTVLRVVADSVFSYMEKECNKLWTRKLDLTDFVLRGVDKDGCVIANYDSIEKDDVVSNGAIIPFKNFKVSNSSFNIYASYKESSGDGYKTCSLLMVEDGSPTTFFAMFPESIDLSDFSGSITPRQMLEVDGVQQVIYEVNLGLNGFYASVGEAFLNFLAYNISFYNIGEKLIKEIQVVMPKVPGVPQDEMPVRIPRRARVNVDIQHVYKDSRLRGILGCMQDSTAFLEFVQTFPEAAITYQWLQKIYQSPWYVECSGKKSEEECVNMACINLLPICRRERLKFALELLSHRYYIYMLGIVNDSLGPVLKGGGVSGESLKRVKM